MEPLLYRRLVPAGGETDAHSYLQSLALRHDATVERPYVVVNFVASVDGRTTVDEQSRKLSDGGDRELFYALRERVDAVLVGTRTLAAEHYKRMLPRAERRERRVAAGLSAEPLAVTITRSGRLPLDIPLFAEPESRVVVFSPTPPVAARLAATVVHAPLTSLPDALGTLYQEHDVRTLLCEGGSVLFGALLQAGLVDELFLTIAPSLVGGASGPAVVSGPPPEAPAVLTLANALERHGNLFLRYQLTGGF